MQRFLRMAAECQKVTVFQFHSMSLIKSMCYNKGGGGMARCWELCIFQILIFTREQPSAFSENTEIIKGYHPHHKTKSKMDKLQSHMSFSTHHRAEDKKKTIKLNFRKSEVFARRDHNCHFFCCNGGTGGGG